MVKCLYTMRETRVQSLVWEDPLEKEMAIHSSTIAWKIPWTVEPGRIQSMGSQRVRHDWATSPSFHYLQIVTILLLPFQYGCLLLLVWLSRTSNTIFKRSGKNGHSCLVPDLTGKAFNISLYVSSGVVINGLCYVEICSLYTHFDDSFYYEWVLNFV